MSINTLEKLNVIRSAISTFCTNAGVDKDTYAAGFEHGYSYGMNSKISVEGVNKDVICYLDAFMESAKDIFDFSKINNFARYYSMVLKGESDTSLFLRGVLQLASNVGGTDGVSITRNLNSVLETTDAGLVSTLSTSNLTMDARGVVVSKKTNGIVVNEDDLSSEKKKNLDMMYELANRALMSGEIAAGEVDLFFFCVYWTIATQMGPLNVKDDINSAYVVDKNILHGAAQALLNNAICRGDILRVTNKITPILKKDRDELSSYHTFYVFGKSSLFSELLHDAFRESLQSSGKTNPSVVKLTSDQVSSHVSPNMTKYEVYGSSQAPKCFVNRVMEGKVHKDVDSTLAMTPSRQFTSNTEANLNACLLTYRVVAAIYSSYGDVLRSLNFV